MHSFHEYSAWVAEEDRNPDLIMPTLGLAGEAGETVDAIKKYFRDDGGGIPTPQRRRDILLELGDVLWYVTSLASRFDSSLAEVATLNKQKLLARRKKNRG